MKKLLLCLVVVLFAVGGVQAQFIHWGPSVQAWGVNETGWISQEGTLVSAINASDSANASVNYGGIDWANTDAAEMLAGVAQNGVTMVAGAANLALANAFGPGLFTDVESFYDGGLYNFQSLNISGLTPGVLYQLQIMNIDDRNTDPRWTVLSDGTQSVADSVAAGTDGHVLIRTDPKGLGSYIFGTFAADATGTLTLDIFGSRGPYTDLDSGSTCQFNALQLREVPEPATMALLGLGSLLSLRRRKRA